MTSIPYIPVVSSKPTEVVEGKYLNLLAHVESWRVYPMNSRPVVGNECGTLAPSDYGGLSYNIIEDRGNVKIINTGFWGTVQIYAPNLDGDLTITQAPKYDNTADVIVTPTPSVNYLNLNPDVPSWRVYKLGASPTVGNECGTLVPSRFGGLSYAIINDKGSIKIIKTATFGEVQIYAPDLDIDCSITTSPRY